MMSTNGQLFKDNESKFEYLLRDLDYFKSNDTKTIDAFSKEILSREYINVNLKLKLVINYTLWNNGDILLSLTMYKIPSNKTFFSLFNFINKHNLKHKIVTKLPAGGEVEPFIKKYFEDLELLFKNELNDQITGKIFENHIDALNESWNQHRDVAYDMERKEIDDFIKKKKH
jgi:hypothetical protein